MSALHAWNNLLAHAWGADAPDREQPNDLSFARGSSVRAVAQLNGGRKRTPLDNVPEGEGEEEEEDADRPTEADSELRQLLAEWSEEPAQSSLSSLDPRIERELGVQWLHEHVATESGSSEQPHSNTSGLFAGAFRAAAREEAEAKKEFEAQMKKERDARAPPAESAAPQPKAEPASVLQQTYILPVKGTTSEEPQAEAEQEGKRPEADFFSLMTAWSDDRGQPFREDLHAAPVGTPAKPAAAAAGKARAKEPPEERRAREMREAAQGCPLLVKLRMELAEEKTVTAPAEYRSFCQRFKASNGILRRLVASFKNLPIAGVEDVPKAKAVPDPMKAPVVVESRRGWRPKTWTQAFWSYEAGEERHKCYHRYPPCATEEETPSTGCVRAQMDEFAKYAGVVRDMDPQCLEEHGLTFPRFFMGGWCPFSSNRAARELWMEDWRSGRQLWAPPGVKDLTHKWVKMCCAGFSLDWETALASFDRVQMGPPGCVTRLHVENSTAHAWYAQVQGKRAFILFSPQEREKLYPEIGWPKQCSEERCEHSPVDVLRPNDKLYPKFMESKAQVAILDPGETLVIPQGWWHYSVLLEPCVTLTRRFWNRVNRSGIADEFRHFVREKDLEEQRMTNVFFSHVEGCRKAIAQDDMPDEDDDPRM